MLRSFLCMSRCSIFTQITLSPICAGELGVRLTFMGAELGIALLLALYILGALGYTAFLLWSLTSAERRKSAGQKLAFALLVAISISVFAVFWWRSNFPAHLTLKNTLVFAFFPGLAIGTLLAEFFYRMINFFRGFQDPEA